ncbi:MAG: PQQ-binding-like beta-propeller repeat protein [Deltaproteobacteria bacterium]|nr:PQQ-binding-like beta-propeller repeat protein [Deltaproteobacteria bacterium]
MRSITDVTTWLITTLIILGLRAVANADNWDWERQFPCKVQLYNGAVADSVLVLLASPGGRVHVVDLATGAVRESISLGAAPAKAMWAGLNILALGSDLGIVYALNLETRELLWRTSSNKKTDLLGADPATKRILLAEDRYVLTAVSPDGDVLWRARTWSGDAVLAGEFVFDRDGVLTATSGVWLWTRQYGGRSATLASSTSVAFSMTRPWTKEGVLELQARQLRGGRLLWRRRLGPKFDMVAAAHCGGRVVLTSVQYAHVPPSQHVRGFNTSTGEELWRADIQGPVPKAPFSPVHVSSNFVCFSSEEGAWALSCEDGRVLWSRNGWNAILGVDDSSFYVTDGCMVQRVHESGRVLWGVSSPVDAPATRDVWLSDPHRIRLAPVEKEANGSKAVKHFGEPVLPRQ